MSLVSLAPPREIDTDRRLFVLVHRLSSNHQSTDKSSDGLLQPESLPTLHVTKRQVVVNEVIDIAHWSHPVFFERMRCG
jgi:hypothetical protein